jgi:hypothetical protein
MPWKNLIRLLAFPLLIAGGCLGWPEGPESWRHPTKDPAEQAADLEACENLASSEHADRSSTVDYQAFRDKIVPECMVKKGYTLEGTAPPPSALSSSPP